MNKRLGRNPFLKDATLDYDVDSEAEWEEGDDDPGEDVENDGDDEDEKLLDEDEEGDTRVYNYQDGWLAQDDEIGEDVDVDDETRELYKARNKKREDGVDLVPVCMVAPADGGIPIVDENGNTDPKLYESKIEGFPVQDALELVRSHNGVTFVEYDIFLDAFPPALTEEREEAAEKSPPQSSEPTEEDLRVVARFVHHSTLLSKPVVIEELRNKHPNATASRAQAQRVLDSIAEKKRHSKIGVYWEVKQSMIDKLGLTGELKVSQQRSDPARLFFIPLFVVTHSLFFFFFCHPSRCSSQNPSLLKLKRRIRLPNESLRMPQTKAPSLKPKRRSLALPQKRLRRIREAPRKRK